MEPKTAAANAMEAVLEARPGESVLVVCDASKREVGQAFATGALELSLWTRMLVLDAKEGTFRSEVPDVLMEIINGPRPPDIYINLLRGQAQETPFRIKIIRLETRKHNSRLGHCPGITIDMLTEGALSLTREDNKKMQDSARNLVAVLQDVDRVHVTSPSGSDFTLSTRGRSWFSDTYIDWKSMKWMNLPTGEVLVGPVETSMQGVLVCDLAVGGVGPLKSPVTLEVKDGRVQKVISQDASALKIVKEAQATDEMARHVGEFAIGLNPKARIVQEFLESEKVGNAIHVAFGNNMDYPGTVANNSANHEDFLVGRPTVTATYTDGREKTIMKNGELVV